MLLHLKVNVSIHRSRSCAANTASSTVWNGICSSREPSGNGLSLGDSSSRNLRTDLEVSILRMCPRYDHRRCIIDLIALNDGDFASSCIDRLVICDNILEFTPFIFFLTCLMVNQADDPYSMVDPTIGANKRRRRSTLSFVFVNTARYSPNFLHATSVRCFTGTIGTPSAAISEPR